MALKTVPERESSFRFKQFELKQEKCAMKIGTDGVLLGAWAAVDTVRNVLDIGTGTGVIAIMLGQRIEEAFIHGIEIDQAAFEEARENMNGAPWANRLEAFHSSIQDYARQTEQRYDLIISNPPFFSGGTFAEDERRSMVRHAVKMPHGDLLRAARGLLRKQGRFCVILPYIEGLRFQELAQQYRLYPQKTTEVRSRVNKPLAALN
ncbi:MAG: methyltransferase, partial [Bacteroidota bacterium]